MDVFFYRYKFKQTQAKNKGGGCFLFTTLKPNEQPQKENASPLYAEIVSPLLLKRVLVVQFYEIPFNHYNAPMLFKRYGKNKRSTLVVLHF